MDSPRILTSRHIFDEPPPRRRKSVEKCTPCREAKQKCSYKYGPWPNRCEFCRQRNLPCSKPQLAPKKQKMRELRQENAERPYVQPTQPDAQSLGSLCTMGYNLTSTTLESFTNDDHDTREAILLLSLRALLLMAVKEMIELAVDMVQPYRRDPLREKREDSIPVLQDTVEEIKDFASAVLTRARGVGSGPIYCGALEALNTLETPLFREDLTWGTDDASLKEVRTTIAFYTLNGHTSLSYILLIKLMQHGVTWTQSEKKNMLAFKNKFAKDIETLLCQGHLSVPAFLQGNQMFTPNILLQNSAFAKQTLYHPRPDYLGRSNFQILYDAGVPVNWVTIRSKAPKIQLGDGTCSTAREEPVIAFQCIFHFSSGPRAIVMPWQDINNADRLGRTILHTVVRQSGMADALTLLEIGANRYLTCLNGLTLLHIAACHGHTELMIRLLTDRWYSHTLSCVDELQRTPFWYAARGSHFGMMDLLAPDFDTEYVDIKDFDPFQADKHGHNPLAIAARNGRVEVLAYLLNLRVKRSQANPIGTMIDINNEHFILAFAVQSTSKECVDLVLKDRVWTCGDYVHQQALAYANQNNDQQVQNVLDQLYRDDYNDYKF